MFLFFSLPGSEQFQSLLTKELQLELKNADEKVENETIDDSVNLD